MLSEDTKFLMEEGGINKFLDVSTGHITEHDASLLTQISSGWLKGVTLTAWMFPYGWWVYLNPELKDSLAPYKEHILYAGFSEAFFDLLIAADAMGCTYICFDRDGLVYEGAPKFEW